MHNKKCAMEIEYEISEWAIHNAYFTLHNVPNQIYNAQFTMHKVQCPNEHFTGQIPKYTI